MFSNLHIYKTNSILQAAAIGVDVSDIDVFVEHHKGSDPTNPDQLSTPGATTALVICFHLLLDSCVVIHIYFKWFACCRQLMAKKMVAQHGDDFNWRGAPVDPMALYNSRGGKPHGR
jgi:hypothetical protein